MQGHAHVVDRRRAVDHAQLIAEAGTAQALEIRAGTQNLPIEVGVAVKHGASRRTNNRGVINDRDVPHRRVQHVVQVRVFLEVFLDRQLHGLAVVGVHARAAQVGHGVARRVNELLGEQLSDVAGGGQTLPQ